MSIEDSLGPVKEELFNEGYIDICDITNPKEAIFYLKHLGNFQSQHQMRMRSKRLALKHAGLKQI